MFSDPHPIVAHEQKLDGPPLWKVAPPIPNSRRNSLPLNRISPPSRPIHAPSVRRRLIHCTIDVECGTPVPLLRSRHATTLPSKPPPRSLEAHASPSLRAPRRSTSVPTPNRP